MISIYFEKNKRLKAYIDGERQEHHEFAERIRPFEGDLHNYLYEPVGSFDTILKYYNIWAKNRHIPGDFLLVRYEDIHENPERELRRVLAFVGTDGVNDEVITEAIKFAAFDSMKKMEKNDKFIGTTLRPADKRDAESMKTRKGKVGGFVNYFSNDEIEYMNSKMRNSLSDYYGYIV